MIRKIRRVPKIKKEKIFIVEGMIILSTVFSYYGKLVSMFYVYTKVNFAKETFEGGGNTSITLYLCNFYGRVGF